MPDGHESFSTLVDVLDGRSSQYAAKTAFTFVTSRANEDTHISYNELHDANRAIGASLQQTLPPGTCVVLLLPTGPAFIHAFFACIYAGLLPVPLPVPRHRGDRRAWYRLQGVLETTGAQWILSNQHRRDLLAADLQKQHGVGKTTWLVMEELAPLLPGAWPAN